MKNWIIVSGALLLSIGCASLNQAKQDYQTGKDVPLAENEISPEQQAKDLVDPITPILPQASYAVGFLAFLFTWKRGRRLRKGQPITETPITGWLGNNLKLEWLVQRLADFRAGLFEVGPDGSSLKRGWKVALATMIGGSLATLPGFQDAIGAQPEATAVLTALLTALIAATEKQLSIVLPTAKASGGTV